ncbi:phosphatase PAP2 family protein [Hymenobacter lapidiphilus]|uniref:Phosphatase PAP2 family protein n=1 Tax=Hymenobacter lapidiphilus TaxID=2608003 RepID=A0A7Y7PMF6_9BACT|nr:phosphatase PAP2 family protein [Hymenobacter lapidiphilus]NVO30440.1 phosphatase PAP2 family protein [Hymenobacter lapidiphilus]
MTKHLRRLLAGFTLFLTEFAVTLALGTAGVVAFLALSREVFDQDAATFDAAAFQWTQALLGAQRQNWVEAVTFLASRNFITAIGLVMVGWLLMRRRRWYSLLVPVVALGSITLNLMLKQLYNRPRPLLPLTSASGLSYPSGHAMISASFYGLLIYFAWTRLRRRPALRYTLVVVLSVLIVLIGLTRIYLRVHYATDVLAGIAAGLAWLIIAIPLLQQLEKRVKKQFRQDPQLAEKQPQ